MRLPRVADVPAEVRAQPGEREPAERCVGKVTIAVDPTAVRGGLFTCRVRRVGFTNSPDVLLGDHNELEERSRYRVEHPQLDLTELRNVFRGRVQETFEEVLENPADKAANARFRAHLRAAAPPLRQLSTDVYEKRVAPEIDVAVLECDVVVTGDFNTVRSERNEIYRRGTIPVLPMLAENPDLVRRLAISVREDDTAFAKTLADHIEPVHLESFFAHELEPPSVWHTGRTIEVEHAAGMIGTGNHLTRSAVFEAGPVRTRGLDDFTDRTSQIFAEIERERVDAEEAALERGRPMDVRFDRGLEL